MFPNFRLWIFAAVGVLTFAAAWHYNMLINERDRLRFEVTRHERTIAALEAQNAANARARTAERERAERYRKETEGLRAIFEAISEGEFTDAPLPPDLIDLLDGLRPSQD